jgi:hypothetical protein
LGFARWIVSPANPLTARDGNRFCKCFSVRTVKSVEDFGAQGEVPSHPELVDWLALGFSKTVGM